MKNPNEWRFPPQLPPPLSCISYHDAKRRSSQFITADLRKSSHASISPTMWPFSKAFRYPRVGYIPFSKGTKELPLCSSDGLLNLSNSFLRNTGLNEEPGAAKQSYTQHTDTYLTTEPTMTKETSIDRCW